MIEAVGVYSAQVAGLCVVISSTKTVEIKCAETRERLVDGTRYRITAELVAEYAKGVGTTFRAKVLSAVPVSDSVQDYARYKGVFRINEYAGALQENQGGELNFYRGDAFSSELRFVALDKTSGWVTVSVPKEISSYSYRAGDLLYVDGKVYHKVRDVGAGQTYELCVRAEVCHKVDGTEYWERVRAAQYRANKKQV